MEHEHRPSNRFELTEVLKFKREAVEIKPYVGDLSRRLSVGQRSPFDSSLAIERVFCIVLQGVMSMEFPLISATGLTLS